VYGRKRRNPNKGKKTVRGIVVEVAEGSQNFAENLNVEPNVDIELGTVSAAKSASTDKVIDIEIDEKEHQAITGFRLLEMTILSNVLALLACPSCLNVCSMRLTEDTGKKRDSPLV